MAKIFYVTEKTDDYTTAHFFKTEKEALAYGISEWSDFDMFGDPDSEDDSYDKDNDVWFEGDWINTPSGILFSFEEGRAYLQSSDDEEARKYVKKEVGSDGAAIFFDKFKKGMYGYLGNGADGKGFKWEWDGDEINESLVTEGKNDYTARYQDTNINLKKAYKHLDDDALNQLYLEIGELIADNKLKVKDATFTFEAEKVTATRKKVLMFEDFVLEGDCKCGGNCTCTTTNEANADGTISADEDELMEDLMGTIEAAIDDLIANSRDKAYEIGGSFRGPGNVDKIKKLLIAKVKKMKL
tara:strand:- start:3329 stop:4222 length:894 start_codon:yes stop_codon:yes gene_type:complete